MLAAAAPGASPARSAPRPGAAEAPTAAALRLAGPPQPARGRATKAGTAAARAGTALVQY